MPLLYDMGHRNECCVTDTMSKHFLPLTSNSDLDLGATDLDLAHDILSHDV